MEYPEDPWNTPDLHKNHNHGPEPSTTNGSHARTSSAVSNGDSLFSTSPQDTSRRSTSAFTTGNIQTSAPPSVVDSTNAWGSLDGVPAGLGGFGDPAHQNPFGTGPLGSTTAPNRTIGGGRTVSPVEETVTVTLMPEKEGIFLFQHHNYEITCAKRGSKVIRRYSDFVWLLECLHKRYPFRVLPLLPPKRIAVNGNHFSNDGAFIEKRRRGLARFLNALVRHPVLSQEQLVVMFLTVPTVSGRALYWGTLADFRVPGIVCLAQASYHYYSR